MTRPAAQAALIEERAEAEMFVRRLANRHECSGMCDRPEHTRDAADLPQVFALLGFFEEIRTYITDAELAHPQIVRKDLQGRRCSTCRQVKSVGDFYTGRKQCKSCFQQTASEYQRRRREGKITVKRRPRKPRISPDEKQCCRCGGIKAAEDFARDARTPDGLRSECKACFNAARSGAAS